MCANNQIYDIYAHWLGSGVIDLPLSSAPSSFFPPTYFSRLYLSRLLIVIVINDVSIVVVPVRSVSLTNTLPIAIERCDRCKRDHVGPIRVDIRNRNW